MPEDLGTALERIAPEVDTNDGWSSLRGRLARRRRRRVLLTGAGVIAAVALIGATAVAVNRDDPVQVATGDGAPSPGPREDCRPELTFPMGDSSPPDAPFGLVLQVRAAEPGDLVDVELVLSPVLQPDHLWGDDWELQRLEGSGWKTTHRLLDPLAGGQPAWLTSGSFADSMPGSSALRGQMVVPPVDPGWHRFLARVTDRAGGELANYELRAYLLLGCGPSSRIDVVPPAPGLVPWTGPDDEAQWFCVVREGIALRYGSLSDAAFIRDPPGLFANLPLLSTFDPDVELPEDAEPTRYTSGDIELWVSPSANGRHVFLVISDRVERWPRLKDALSCD